MDYEIESKINSYLANPTKPYQDWYTGFNQAETEDEQYTIEVGVIPPIDKIKEFFEKWFNDQRDFLKGKICDEWVYCQKKKDFSQNKLISILAESLRSVLPIPVNFIATATILYVGNYLNHLCECE